MRYLLGIDIGTSGTKTVLFNEKGETAASALYEYPMYQPNMGWAEQDPEDWWQAAVSTIQQVLNKSGVKPSDVVSVGMSGQMHGMVLLDKNGQLLRNSIIWCDQRTAVECAEITETIGAERLMEITGNPALTGFTAGKVMWVKNNQPEIFEKIDKILLPKDYIRYRLTGDFATEVSDASGMQFLDVPNRCWSDEVISKLGIEKNWLGQVYESPEVTGRISKIASELTGLTTDTLVVGGAGDQAAGAVGNGVVRSGVISSTIGTSGVVFAHMDNIKIDKPLGRLQAFCCAVPGEWHVMGVVKAAGYSYQWLRNHFGHMEMSMASLLDTDPYELLSLQAAKSKPGCDGLIYLPYLMGERTPHLNPDARAVLFGLTAAHTRSDVIRSVMEGVTYALKDCLEIIKGMGVEAKHVIASGGGGRSELWRQMQADIFDSPIVTINSSEGPALGAAILAGVGAAVYESVPKACDDVISIVTSQEPIKKNIKLYNKYYKVFNDLYPSVVAQFDRLKDIAAEIE